MDEMRLESKFTTGLVSKIARTVVRKKLGYDMDIRLNRLRTRWLMKRHTYIWTSIWSSRRKSLTNY